MSTAVVRTRTPRRRPVFHPLAVARIDELTEDAVAVTFAVPPELRDEFAFLPGQHLTVRRMHPGDGSEVRRSYSICSTPDELREHGRVRIGVRRISGGVFSTLATSALGPGDTVEVLPPLGHFTTEFDPQRTRQYAAVAAGSGITPVLSLLATGLSTEPKSRFTLLYVNRRASTVMFAEELADLKDRYPDRLQVVYAFSREPQLSALLSGRVDADRMRAILDTGLIDVSLVDEWFLCGPYGMVMDIRGVLAERDVPDASVHTELFHVPEEGGGSQRQPEPARRDESTAESTEVTITLDGRESSFVMRRDERVLDAALRVRSELPYACKGGVCSTCRGRLVEGEVRMVQNYALEPDEIAAGYILTCQSQPVSDRLVVDYDA
ncbi:MAG TPA: 1,2-phenylacetyl-CoA epoxidase subunit PaaE [Micromonosporaceae bacterium]|nr:1,2-phenylacetyl-CoA epoxidase subunit PaaE [Micromonosporaceae bacterium]